MKLYEKQFPVKEGGYISVELLYLKNSLKRGYYSYVNKYTTEEKVGYAMVSFDPFMGESNLIKQVARKSAKAEREAIEAVESECYMLAHGYANRKNFTMQ